MPRLIVATSKSLAAWAEDVGLTKHVYHVGVVDGEAAAAIEALNADLHAGVGDWTLLATGETSRTEAEVQERLAAKETVLDPRYYPRLRDATSLVKVKPAHVANHLLVQAALTDKPVKAGKPKEKDFGAYLLRNIA
ncbi:MAG: hypothetical protein EAZ99_04480 [Alphaproteobacteria bacterium]|nr:hypothetical protein [Alphaproteobacteria bacterium]TAD91047.1 MAG: hypothetical protein EAZ99_04480 [Alphaproteobacteria bacterium]